MPKPTTRDELVEEIQKAYSKLSDDLDRLGGRYEVVCVDDWTARDLLAVRLWWTEAVIGWIREGRRGGTPQPPAPGYRWNETPRLNADTVAATEDDGATLRRRLDAAVADVLALIDTLDDADLLEPGRYDWAGKWPLSRWLSIGTTRQYTSARTYVRKALRALGD
ncbi:MAG: ClbS/DfsB family four-helix bundle protein [Acidobacteriota bacterium]